MATNPIEEAKRLLADLLPGHHGRHGRASRSDWGNRQVVEAAEALIREVVRDEIRAMHGKPPPEWLADASGLRAHVGEVAP